MLKLKNIGEKDVIYELVLGTEGLTSKDKDKIYKLALKIENKEGVAKKFEQSNYNTRKILKTKITCKHQGIEETFTLLQHAIFHKNNQAIKDLLEEAKKQKLLEEVLNEQRIIKCSDGHKIIHSTLTCVALLEDDEKTEIFDTFKEQGILEDVLNAIKTMEYQNNLEEIHEKLVDAISNKNTESARAVLSASKGIVNLEDVLDKEITIQQVVKRSLFEYAKKNSERITKIFEELKDDLNVPNTECKDNEIITDIEEQENIATDAKTDTELCGDINKDGKDLQPICESSEEAQVETTVEPTSVNRETNKQEPNSLESPSSAEPYFDATDEKDKPLTQQRQAILAGVVGAVLLVSCVALYIMKMPLVAVVVGIVGLVCIGFALYNIINPNTKLEKVKSVEQPIIQSPLNPTYAQKTSSKFQIS